MPTYRVKPECRQVAFEENASTPESAAEAAMQRRRLDGSRGSRRRHGRSNNFSAEPYEE